MKKYYKEQYETCIFFARVNYYTLIGRNDELIDKIYKVLLHLEKKYPLFFNMHNIKGPFNRITKLSRWLMRWIPSISCIYKLPFVNSAWTMNPKKSYQKWCEAFDEYFTTDETNEIINKNLNHKGGPARDFMAQDTWVLMKEQEKYIPILSEIKWIYNNNKYGKFFIEKA